MARLTVKACGFFFSGMKQKKKLFKKQKSKNRPCSISVIFFKKEEKNGTSVNFFGKFIFNNWQKLYVTEGFIQSC